MKILDAKIKIENKYPNKFEIIDDLNFKYRDDKIRIKCKDCGIILDRAYSSIMRYNCPSCLGLKNNTSTFKEKLFKIHNNKIELIGEYINSGKKVKVKCEKKIIFGWQILKIY